MDTPIDVKTPASQAAKKTQAEDLKWESRLACERDLTRVLYLHGKECATNQRTGSP